MDWKNSAHKELRKKASEGQCEKGKAGKGRAVQSLFLVEIYTFSNLWYCTINVQWIGELSLNAAVWSNRFD
jgi:hypothetical protein